MPNRLRIILFRVLRSSALLFSSGMVLLAGQSAALASTTPSRPQLSWPLAEAKCNFYYINRGPSPPPSKNANESMRRYEQWIYALVNRTESALVRLPNPPGAGVSMIRAMDRYRVATLKIASAYGEGGSVPELKKLEAVRQPAKQEVQRLAGPLKTPSCYKVVDLDFQPWK